ncbi:myomegalin isoform X1, partial [Tachysurus ichikawai]
PSPSPPVRDVGPFPSGPPCSPYSELEESSLTANDSLEPHADLEGDAPDGSFANQNGRHAIGHVDDFSALQQQVMKGQRSGYVFKGAFPGSFDRGCVTPVIAVETLSPRLAKKRARECLHSAAS